MLDFIKKHKILSVVAVILISSLIILAISYHPEKKTTSKKSSNTASKSSHKSTVKYKPLTEEQKEKVKQAILSSEFISAIPEKYPISIKFFFFENGSRIWQDKFIMADGKILSSGSPGISLTLHSKYIDDLEKMNLCDLIKTAKKNKDLGFYSKYSDASLMWKYRSLLKYRDCFGL